MSGVTERVEAVLAEHIRLTYAEQPFACSCQPHLSDGTQPYRAHVATAIAAALTDAGDADVVEQAARFRVEVACDGYAALMESDVPEAGGGGFEYDPDSYIAGAAAAAENIRAALLAPAAQTDEGAGDE